MKKIILLLFYICVLVACSKEDKPYLSISSNNLEFPSSGGEEDITIESNDSWNITSSSWIEVSKTNGAGNATIKIIVTQSDLNEDRSGSITIASPTTTQTIIVKQAQRNKIIPHETTHYFPYQGGEAVLKFETNIETEITCPDWISHSSNTKALTSKEITIIVSRNTESSREGYIMITGKGKDKNVKCNIHILQDGFYPLKEIKFEEGNSYSITHIDGNKITPIFYPENASNREIEWSTSNPNIVEINDDGSLIIHNNGTSIITAYNKEANISAEVHITVNITLESLSWEMPHGFFSIKPNTICANNQHTFTIPIEYAPAIADISDLRIRSANEDLVKADGLTLTCSSINEGETEITFINNVHEWMSIYVSVKDSYIYSGRYIIGNNEIGKVTIRSIIFSNNPNDRINVNNIRIVKDGHEVVDIISNFENNNSNRVYCNFTIDGRKYFSDEIWMSRPSLFSEIDKWIMDYTYSINGEWKYKKENITATKQW